MGQLRFFEYDDLGRPLNERLAPTNGTCPTTETQASWPLLTAWTYDPANGIGATATAITYDGSGHAQVTATVPSGAFDARGRLTKTTVQVNAADNPDAAHPEDDFLDTALTTEQHYTRDNQIWQTVYPAMNFGAAITTDLGSPETVTVRFNTLAMPSSSSSNYGGGFTYVASTTYDAVGRITGRTMGGTGSTFGLTRSYTYQASDGAISNLAASSITPLTDPNPSATLIQNDSYTYDDAGNPSRIAHDPAGTTNDQTECFQYDARQRLARGFTLAGGNATCTPPASPTGPAPYDESYTFNALDQFLTNGTTAGIRLYDTAGSSVSGCTANTNTIKPHATASIGAPGSGDTASGHEYTYDCNGSITEDIDHTANTTTDFYWDSHNVLTTSLKAHPGDPLVTESAVYDASGQRALRTVSSSGGATTKTVTIGSIQYQWTSSQPTVVNSVRSYSVAQRGDLVSGGDTCVWVTTNSQGSVVSLLENFTGTTSAIFYAPYGRIVDGIPLNDFGFLNGTLDGEPNLVYLRNRYYNATDGLFMSVDPLVLTTGTPYLYGNGNPMRYTDADGLDANFVPECGNVNTQWSACGIFVALLAEDVTDEDAVSNVMRSCAIQEMDWCSDEDGAAKALAEMEATLADHGPWHTGGIPNEGCDWDVSAVVCAYGLAILRVTGDLNLIDGRIHQYFFLATGGDAANDQYEFINSILGVILIGAGNLGGASAADIAAVETSTFGALTLEEQLAIATEHLSSIEALTPPNRMMLERIGSRLEAGQELTIGEQNFLLHETTEARLVSEGIYGQAAHELAGTTHPTYANYDPEVIMRYPEYFNKNWEAYWGIG